MQGLRGPWHPGLDHTGSLGVATGNPRWIFGAHAADLRVQLLRCSLTHARCARSAARSFTRISATWIAESLSAASIATPTYRLPQARDFSPAFEGRHAPALDHVHDTRPDGPPCAAGPDGRAPLVDAEQGERGRGLAGRLDPLVPERVEMREHGGPGHDAQRVDGSAVEAIRPARANQGVAAQRHRAGG